MLRYTKSQNPVREELVNYLTVSLLVIAGAGMVTFWGLAHSAVYVSEHVLYLVACTIWATFLTVQVEIHKCKIRSVAKTVPADNISEVAES